MRRLELGNLPVVLCGGPDRAGGGDGPVVVLLHGYGAPAEDLVPLFRTLDVPREVRFAFPAAPLVLDSRVPAEFSGRAWWPLDMVQLNEIATSGKIEKLQALDPAGLPEARAQVEALLDALTSTLSARPESIVIGGFSQGAMLATELVLATDRPFAGLSILSGTLMRRSAWAAGAPSRSGFRVLQSHGRADPIVPFANAEALRDLMSQAGLKVEWLPTNGGHGIPDGAVERLGAFIRSTTSGDGETA
jgi:phospholipase/carboxylesterase